MAGWDWAREEGGSNSRAGMLFSIAPWRGGQEGEEGKEQETEQNALQVNLLSEYEAVVPPLVAMVRQEQEESVVETSPGGKSAQHLPDGQVVVGPHGRGVVGVLVQVQVGKDRTLQQR